MYVYRKEQNNNKKKYLILIKTVLQQWYYVHVDQNIDVSFIYLGICICNENMNS